MFFNRAKMFIFFYLNDKYSRKWYSIDGVLGTRTRGGRMVGPDESTEQWRHPFIPSMFKNGPTPASLLFIFVFIKHNLYRKTVGVSGIRTRIVGVEGEHADHLTTTTALIPSILHLYFHPLRTKSSLSMFYLQSFQTNDYPWVYFL